jgi:hypothetical protein
VNCPKLEPPLISTVCNYPGSSKFRFLVDTKDDSGIIALVRKKIAQGASGFDLCFSSHPEELDLLIRIGTLIQKEIPGTVLFMDTADPEIFFSLLEHFPYPFVINSIGPAGGCRRRSLGFTVLVDLLRKAKERGIQVVIQLNPYDNEDPLDPLFLSAIEEVSFPASSILWDPLLYPPPSFKESIPRFMERARMLKGYGGRILVCLANILLCRQMMLPVETIRKLYNDLANSTPCVFLTPVPVFQKNKES